MSELRIYPEANPDPELKHCHAHADIAAELARIGVRFERWQTRDDIVPGTAQAAILEAYSEDIRRLQEEHGYVTADVISLARGSSDVAALRSKFLSEHVHGEDEVRFFVAGRGLFSLHVDGRVYEVLCEQGDLIGVPANTRHWFDMGPDPEFVVIRLFNNPDGWVARFTGEDIAERFHRLER
jgi:1,2-dihydroxy-3-keto-5-methylthiopentene dioxygenase